MDAGARRDDPGSSRFLAGLLLLAVVFAAGVAIGSARVPAGTGGFGSAPSATASAAGAASPSPAATAAAATPGPTSGPITSPTPTPRVTPGPTIGPGATVPPFAPSNVGLLWDALRLTQEHFVRRGQLDPNRLTYGAISGLIGALGDPGHTAFLTPDQAQSESEALDGTIVGVGIYLAVESGTPVIVSVIDRSPADRAGIRSGDALVGINGASAAALTVEEIASRIRGAEGTTVTLTVIHPGTDVPVDITIRRERIVVPAVTWAMVPGTTIADLRVTQFSAGAGDEFDQALRAARQAGASALVVDLRSNPGGYVGEAVEIVSSLVENGTVYVRRTADGEEIPVPVKGSALAPDIPLVVLIDYGSASSAEITAGALQDNARGRLVGIRTFGTGTVLNTFSLPDGSALRLAVEEWLTPNRSFIFPTGITPDERVELDLDAAPLDPIDLRDLTPAGLRASGDTQLLRAIDLLRGG